MTLHTVLPVPPLRQTCPAPGQGCGGRSTASETSGAICRGPAPCGTCTVGGEVHDLAIPFNLHSPHMDDMVCLSQGVIQISTVLGVQ